MNKSILVVDDEKPIADILQFKLEREGFTVHVAGTGPEALDLARRTEPDLVILDIMLPGMDGFEVCRELRKFAQIPVLMLTARDEEIDKVVGLEIGADDYVTKPFSPRELVARVKAILRRMQRHVEQSAETLEVGDLRLDLATYQATLGERPLDLTPREFELLRHLAMRPGQVYAREEILEQVWGPEYLGELRTVDVTVRRLREKLEPDPSSPHYVLTRRGVGYYLRREQIG